MIFWVVGIFIVLCFVCWFIQEATGIGTYTSTESDDHMATLMMHSAMYDDDWSPGD